MTVPVSPLTAHTLPRRASRGVTLFAGAALGLVLAFGAAAQGASPAAWQKLSPAQRQALAPLERDWATIEPDRRSKWLEIAARFPNMPADEQRRVQERMAEWARMTPAERGRARLQFQQTKDVPLAERQARWEAYQALPADQRKELATRAAPAAAAKPAATPDRKHNIVTPTAATPPARPVAPTVVQGGPGATTKLVTERPKPPAHQQTGLPKIAATPQFVDRDTLLPKRGPQGAAATRLAASAPGTAAP